MAVAEETLKELRSLLKECAAHLTAADGQSRGSGFFIDDDLLLTCAHVVKGPKEAKVTVEPYGRPPREGTIVDYLPGDDKDLALVRVEALEGERPQPAVALDVGLADAITYYAVGYPKESLIGAVGLEEIGYRGHGKSPAPGESTLLMLEAGQAAVTSGLSGGALLNSETGAVVAIAQYSEDTKSAAGGAAIPVARAGEAFEDVARRLAEPPLATRRWRDALGRERWLALGKPWGWQRSLDIVISGDRTCWSVKVGGEQHERRVTVRDLPDELVDALFQWAQRRGIRATEEVMLLGRLLAGAVLPSPVSAQIARNQLADELLIRLTVDGAKTSDLFDVPWEFVTFRANGEDRPLAAQERMGFVRIGEHAAAAGVTTAPWEGNAGVIALVVQPEEWQADMPRLVSGNKAVEWPKLGHLMTKLDTAAAGAAQFRVTKLENPTASDVEAELQRAQGDVSTEVLHYIGFGRMEGAEPRIAISDGYGDVEWREIDDLFRWAARSGARLVVVEFALPPFGIDWEPVPARAFLEALRGRVNAVVFTRFPVHERQFHRFNAALYAVLGEGKSIEEAVQRARQDVSANRLLGDAGAFGSFALITGPKSGTQLVAPMPGDPRLSGPKSEEVDPRRETEAVERRLGDAFRSG